MACRCPAGGCVIALCCDYRVMTDSGRIGLNEVELGIPVPKFWALLMGRVVGTGVADKLCGAAQMCAPQRAKEVGMVDEVAAGGQLLQARSGTPLCNGPSWWVCGFVRVVCVARCCL